MTDDRVRCTTTILIPIFPYVYHNSGHCLNSRFPHFFPHLNLDGLYLPEPIGSLKHYIYLYDTQREIYRYGNKLIDQMVQLNEVGKMRQALLDKDQQEQEEE